MPVAKDVTLGPGVVIHHPDLVNLYGCKIGDLTKIGAFVEIQKNATIGAQCKISSHSFICEGVTIEDRVFVGHGVMFINDVEPRATNADGSLQAEADWTLVPTRRRDHGWHHDRRARHDRRRRRGHQRCRGRRSCRWSARAPLAYWRQASL